MRDPENLESFFTQRPGFTQPPPYLPPVLQVPPAPLLIAVVEGLIQTKAALQAQITGLKQVLHLHQELGDLSLEIQNLQETMRRGQDSPNRRPPWKKHQPKLTFPVMTTARDRQTRDKPESDSTSLNQGGDRDEDQETEGGQDYDQVAEDSEGEESDQEDYETLCPMYKKLKFKSIKELHSAVKIYGMNAPFTMSTLEGLTGSYTQ